LTNPKNAGNGLITKIFLDMEPLKLWVRVFSPIDLLGYLKTEKYPPDFAFAIRVTIGLVVIPIICFHASAASKCSENVRQFRKARRVLSR
jgi:hypothetical protein